jgi:tungstate transport system substrate-binding protein
VAFLVAPGTQRLIGSFGRAKFGQQLFVPDAGKTEAKLGLH